MLKLARNLTLVFGLVWFCVACGESKPSKPNLSNGIPQDDFKVGEGSLTETSADKSYVVSAFQASYQLPEKLAKRLETARGLNFSIRVMGDSVAGLYRIYSCGSDVECRQPFPKYTIQCTEKIECGFVDEMAGGKVSPMRESRLIDTFRYLWSFEGGKSGIDLFVADPQMMPDGFHDEILAAEFQPEVGKVSNLKTFYFKTERSTGEVPQLPGRPKGKENPCTINLLGVRNWASLTDGEYTCLVNTRGYSSNVARVCGRSQGQGLSASFAQYLDLKKKYEKVSAEFSALPQLKRTAVEIERVQRAHEDLTLLGDETRNLIAVEEAKQALEVCRERARHP